MTISSEITRLQEAKTNIKASIENKGVPVPNSAKYDDYSGYIDQISTSSGLYSGISITPFVVNGGSGYLGTGSTGILATISFYQDGTNYGCIAYHIKNTSSSKRNAAISGSKKQMNSDFVHVSNYVSGDFDREDAYIKDGQVWTNGSLILIDFTLPGRYESQYKYKRGIWNYKGDNSITFSDISVDTPIPSGYEHITKNEWIKNVKIEFPSGYQYVNVTLTLK